MTLILKITTKYVFEFYRKDDEIAFAFHSAQRAELLVSELSREKDYFTHL